MDIKPCCLCFNFKDPSQNFSKKFFNTTSGVLTIKTIIILFTFQEPIVEIKHHLLLKHLTMLYQLVLYGEVDSHGKTQYWQHFMP
jgi:hypothetical protein